MRTNIERKTNVMIAHPYKLGSVEFCQMIDYVVQEHNIAEIIYAMNVGASGDKYVRIIYKDLPDRDELKPEMISVKEGDYLVFENGKLYSKTKEDFDKIFKFVEQPVLKNG